MNGMPQDESLLFKFWLRETNLLGFSPICSKVTQGSL